MAETVHRRRSSFIVPGEEWPLRPRHSLRESKRIIKWPTATSSKKESAKPTQSVVGFMKWMRKLMDVVEIQRQNKRQKLAQMAIRRTVKSSK